MFTAKGVWEYIPSTHTFREVILKKGKFVTHDDNNSLQAHHFDYEYAQKKQVSYSNPNRIILQRPPIPIITLQASPVNAGEISLTWNNDYTGNSNFEVWRGITSDQNTFTKLGNALTRFDDTTTNPETTYYYQIRTTFSGFTNSSNIVSVTTPAPSNLLSNVSELEPIWEWDPNFSKYAIKQWQWNPNRGVGENDNFQNQLHIKRSGDNFWAFDRGIQNPSSGDAVYKDYLGLDTYILSDPGQSLRFSYYTYYPGLFGPAIYSDTNTRTFVAPPQP